MGAWSSKLAGTPTGVWHIEDIHRGLRGRTGVPMGAWSNKIWPGHLRGCGRLGTSTGA